MKKKLLVIVTVITLLIMCGCSSTPADQATEDQAPAVTEETQEDAAADTSQATDAAADTSQATDAAADTGQATDAAAKISESEAKAIALKHAGLKEADVKFTKFNEDMDDGVWQYEIEFVSGETEYDYEINMERGEILDFGTDSIYDD